LRYRSMPEKLLDVLGMHVAGEKQGGARMPEIVEAHR
jgi:hypothetical protein